MLERATEKPHSGRRKPTAQSHYRRPKWGASQGRETGAGIVPSSPYLKQGKEAGTNDADRRPDKQGRDGSQERNRRHHDENAEAPLL